MWRSTPKVAHIEAHGKLICHWTGRLVLAAGKPSLAVFVQCLILFFQMSWAQQNPKHIFSALLFLNPYVLWEQFNSYVSDLFTCKSSECCFVWTIWCPGSLLSFAFEVFFFSPLLRISNHDLQIEKKAHQSPNILNLKDSNFVQKVDGVKSEDNSYNLPTVFSRS